MKIVALLIGLPLLGAWTEPPRSLPPSPTPCAVARIVDGDTFVCASGLKVRVRGVDTPERGEPRYLAAGDELARRIGGRQVTLIPHHRNRDRVVADVMLGGVNVGAAMDAAGWSKPLGARR